jgi:hypothetical protein
VKIEISEHTLERAVERGTNKKEISDVVLSGIQCSAKGDRSG